MRLPKAKRDSFQMFDLEEKCIYLKQNTALFRCWSMFVVLLLARTGVLTLLRRKGLAPQLLTLCSCTTGHHCKHAITQQTQQMFAGSTLKHFSPRSRVVIACSRHNRGRLQKTTSAEVPVAKVTVCVAMPTQMRTRPDYTSNRSHAGQNLHKTCSPSQRPRCSPSPHHPLLFASGADVGAWAALSGAAAVGEGVLQVMLYFMSWIKGTYNSGGQTCARWNAGAQRSGNARTSERTQAARNGKMSGIIVTSELVAALTVVVHARGGGGGSALVTDTGPSCGCVRGGGGG